MPRYVLLGDDMWHGPGGTVAGIITPPVDPGPGPWSSDGWAAAVGSRNWSTMQAWYQARAGIESVGYSVDDLVAGSLVSAYDGQVIEGIRGTAMRVAHNNVTYRGCLVEGGGTYGYYTNPTFGAGYTGTLVEGCTLIGGTPPIDKAAVLCASSPSAGIAATFRGCELVGWSSGFLANGGVDVEYCYIHDFYPSSVGGAHVSSIVARGANVRFYRNYATEGGSPICSIYFDMQAVHNVTIQENILSARLSLSGNLPSYLLFGKAGSYEASATGIVVGGNYLGDTAGVDFQFGRFAGMGAVAWGSNGNVRTPDIDFLTGATI